MSIVRWRDMIALEGSRLKSYCPPVNSCHSPHLLLRHPVSSLNQSLPLQSVLQKIAGLQPMPLKGHAN
jgi:hypothetical protein